MVITPTPAMILSASYKYSAAELGRWQASVPSERMAYQAELVAAVRRLGVDAAGPGCQRDPIVSRRGHLLVATRAGAQVVVGIRRSRSSSPRRSQEYALENLQVLTSNTTTRRALTHTRHTAFNVQPGAMGTEWAAHTQPRQGQLVGAVPRKERTRR